MPFCLLKKRDYHTYNVCTQWKTCLLDKQENMCIFFIFFCDVIKMILLLECDSRGQRRGEWQLWSVECLSGKALGTENWKKTIHNISIIFFHSLEYFAKLLFCSIISQHYVPFPSVKSASHNRPSLWYFYDTGQLGECQLISPTESDQNGGLFSEAGLWRKRYLKNTCIVYVGFMLSSTHSSSAWSFIPVCKYTYTQMFQKHLSCSINPPDMRCQMLPAPATGRTS